MVKRTACYLIRVSTILTLALGLSTSLAVALPPELLPTLSIEAIESRIGAVSLAFDERWKSFAALRKFAPWVYQSSDAEVLAEYEHLDNERRWAWFVDPHADTLIARSAYSIAQDLLAYGLFREFNTIAFDYNKTDSSYNSSTIVLNGFRFLAMQGPKPEHVTNFMTLLVNHRVGQLVRLTPATEGKVQKCAPYWLGRTMYSKQDGLTYLNLSQSTQGTGKPYALPYYAMDDWRDDAAGNPGKLLDLILKVRKNHSKMDTLAVHCSSGVSRTGTFIAGFLLVHEIDQKFKDGKPISHLDISVERIVSQLSLMRPHAVGKPSQYLTLYRLVDLYLKDKVEKKVTSPTAQNVGHSNSQNPINNSEDLNQTELKSESGDDSDMGSINTEMDGKIEFGDLVHDLVNIITRLENPFMESLFEEDRQKFIKNMESYQEQGGDLSTSFLGADDKHKLKYSDYMDKTLLNTVLESARKDFANWIQLNDVIQFLGGDLNSEENMDAKNDSVNNINHVSNMVGINSDFSEFHVNIFNTEEENKEGNSIVPTRSLKRKFSDFGNLENKMTVESTTEAISISPTHTSIEGARRWVKHTKTAVRQLLQSFDFKNWLAPFSG